MSNIVLGGWIPPSERTKQQQNAHAEAVHKFVNPFRGPNPFENNIPPKFLLTDLWKHPKVIEALGYEWIGVQQESGSCVWAGGQDCQNIVCWVDALMRGQPEKIVVPFGLMNYGRSRLYMGDRNPGDGSLGSTYARSCSEDGSIDSADPSLPQPRNNGQGMFWGQQAEMTWSDGDEKRITNLLPQSRLHLWTTSSMYTTFQEAWDSIGRLEPCTIACNGFIDPDSCRVMGSGDDAALVGQQFQQGGHQEKILGRWDNKSLGRMLWKQNNWGMNAFKQDPGGGPRGGCWILEKTFPQYIRMDGEVIAFKGWEGIANPGIILDWNKIGGW